MAEFRDKSQVLNEHPNQWHTKEKRRTQAGNCRHLRAIADITTVAYRRGYEQTQAGIGNHLRAIADTTRVAYRRGYG